jgi:hypothetical protein
MTAGPQARDRCGPADSGQGGEFGQLYCHLATQCRSNPVSGPGLPKTGIFQISAGDYQRFRSGAAQIRCLETHLQFTKARHWQAFLAFPRVMSPGAGLPGWGGRIRTSAWWNQNPLPACEVSALAVSRMRSLNTSWRLAFELSVLRDLDRPPGHTMAARLLIRNFSLGEKRTV